MKHSLHIIPLFASILIGTVCFCVVASLQSDFDPAKFGLGLNTTTHTEYDGDDCISTGSGMEPFIDHFAELSGRERDVVLWLGASQLHAINDYEPGDHLAVHYLTEDAKQRGSDLAFLLSSQPNAGYHDLLSMYLYFRARGLVPDWLAVAVVYDDLREEKILSVLARELKAVPDDAVEHGGKGVERILAHAQSMESGEEKKQAPVERNATAGTPQEALEEKLVGALEATLPGYGYVGRLSARISINIKITLADLLSGKLKQTRAPSIPKHQEDWSHDALLSLLELAGRDGCNVLLYRQPHRPSTGRFYHDRGAFDAYWERIKELSDPTRGVHVLDLEKIVPAHHYGLTNSGRPDAFHFTDDGHRLLAQHLGKFFKNIEERGTGALQ